MKQLFRFLLLLPICAACNSGLDMDEPPTGQNNGVIGFNAKMEKTRAVADINSVKSDGFSVWGGFVVTPNLFNGRTVTFSDPNWVCEGPSEVWTLNNQYSFFAVHPLQNANKVTAYTSDSKVHHKFSYTLPANAGTDLLIAVRRLTVAESDNGSVNFNFTHALSNINVKVQKNKANSEDEVVVRQVSIKNVKKSGIYKTETLKWEECVDGFNFTSASNLNVTLPVNSAGEPQMETIISDLCFIPQEIVKGSVQLSIVYSIKADGSTDFYTADAYIPGITWESQKVYTYNLTLGAQKNDILFGVPEVLDWERTDQVGGSVMIQ